MYTELDDALKDGYDGYTVASSPATHFGIAKKMIEAGKPVLVEKPLTLNNRDARELVRLQYIYSNRLNLGTVRLEKNVIWSFAPHDI